MDEDFIKALDALGLEEFDPADYITNQRIADYYMEEARRDSDEEFIKLAEDAVRRAGFEVK